MYVSWSRRMYIRIYTDYALLDTIDTVQYITRVLLQTINHNLNCLICRRVGVNQPADVYSLCCTMYVCMCVTSSKNMTLHVLFIRHQQLEERI